MTEFQASSYWTRQIGLRRVSTADEQVAPKVTTAKAKTHSELDDQMFDLKGGLCTNHAHLL